MTHAPDEHLTCGQPIADGATPGCLGFDTVQAITTCKVQRGTAILHTKKQDSSRVSQHVRGRRVSLCPKVLLFLLCRAVRMGCNRREGKKKITLRSTFGVDMATPVTRRSWREEEGRARGRRQVS